MKPLTEAELGRVLNFLWVRFETHFPSLACPFWAAVPLRRVPSPVRSSPRSLVGCPGHNVSSADPSDNHETETGGAFSYR